MEYTIQKLGNLAGISTRTLRYYDEMDLLKPARINSSGYRIYGSKEISVLQQILFYKELGVSLEDIKNIITSENFDVEKALAVHLGKLIEKHEQLELLIQNIQKTISDNKGEIKMSDKEKFEGFKKKMIDENEEKYGKEIREKYGDKTVNASNAKVLNMTEEDQQKLTKLSEDIISTLLEAYNNGDPSTKIAQKAVDLHRQWLCFYWDSYSKDAHLGLGEMYVSDERFKMYFDQHQEGLAEFFRDAINIYANA